MVRKNYAFLAPFGVLTAICLALFLKFPKGELHLAINQCHFQQADLFFRILTHLGDGAVIVALCLIIGFCSVRNALMLLATYTFSGLFVQLLKKAVFSDILRPVGFFGPSHQLHLVEGVTNFMHQSFPSGHSTTAFAFFFGLSLLSDRWTVKLTCFVCAALVAFSRVYLSQHFLQDITAGAWIGTLFAWVGYVVFVNGRTERMNKPLIAILKKH